MTPASASTRAVPARILVVDDEPQPRTLTAALLEPLGHRVELAESGREALSLARVQLPDIIVLDIMMPGVDGYAVARELKAHAATASIPILVLTSLDGPDEKAQAIEAGATVCLTKPITPVELRAHVTALIRAKSAHDAAADYRQRLEEEVEHRTRDLRTATERIRTASIETIYRLAAAVDERDQDTGGHCLRVGLYAAVLARQLGLDHRLVEDLEAAAPMHDIGKIGIPDRVLLKTSRLTPEEWQIMREHTTIGAGILHDSKADVIQLAEIIALTHHEWWDGRGYPNGRSGLAIPWGGRIVAVADALDALCASRRYRAISSHPLDGAITTIAASRRTQFDPDVVDALQAVRAEIAAIQAEHPDAATRLIRRLNDLAAGRPAERLKRGPPEPHPNTQTPRCLFI